MNISDTPQWFILVRKKYRSSNEWHKIELRVDALVNDQFYWFLTSLAKLITGYINFSSCHPSLLVHFFLSFSLSLSYSQLKSIVIHIKQIFTCVHLSLHSFFFLNVLFHSFSVSVCLALSLSLCFSISLCQLFKEHTANNRQQQANLQWCETELTQLTLWD